MSEKLKFRISSAVAAFVRTGLDRGDRLRGLEVASTLSPVDHITLLFCLMRDVDRTVKEAGTAAFRALPEELIVSCCSTPDIHPAILDALAQHHHDKSAVVTSLLECPTLSPQARAYLEKVELINSSLETIDSVAQTVSDDVAPDSGVDEPEQGLAETVCGDDLLEENLAENVVGEDGVDAEEDVEHLSKYKLIQQMGIGEKIKMALTGDKEWRAILVNDTNKMVSSSVIKNPRITDGEIIRILKVGVQNDEIVRLICDNREWVKNPLIRKALIDCPKTPLPNALRYLASLSDKEIAAYAKSKNISSVISTQAKRIILAKKR